MPDFRVLTDPPDDVWESALENMGDTPYPVVVTYDEEIGRDRIVAVVLTYGRTDAAVACAQALDRLEND